MENEQDQQKEHAFDGIVQGPVRYLQDLISNGDIKSPEASINTIIRESNVDINLISDGYHTFGELYEHRIELFIALCARNTDVAWKSKLHHGGTSIEGWFIMGLYQVKGFQITYHLPMSYWDRCAFVLTLDRAPEWDGHTSADVIKRLREL